jgi:hypothetical protein
MNEQYGIDNAVEQKLRDLQAENERLRVGLLDLQHAAAAQTMSNDNNNARATFAHYENQIKALLERAGKVTP